MTSQVMTATSGSITSLNEKIRQHASGMVEQIIAHRRYFHMHPELSNEEVGTAAYICKVLTGLDIPYKSGIAGTGVVALIEGRDPSSDCVALRADMDALPVNELNDVPYKSRYPGKMHACGHDVHMACLLGAAAILNTLRDEFSGTVKLIFQPSEESYPGGAIGMIDEGVLENPSPRVVIAQHVINTMNAGEVGMRPGPYMASTDEVYITVHGKGGHAATPSQVIDPVLIASHIVVALQQVVSRNADPLMPTVVSFGRMMAEGRTNVIPDVVKLEGTVRTYDETWRKEVHQRISALAENIASGMGGRAEVRIAHGYPALFNDPALTNRLHDLATEYLGESNVIHLEQRMTAEDFAYFARHRPSCLFRLGIAEKEKGVASNLHTATFDVDEQCLETGAAIMAWFAVGLCGSKGW